jgi:Zn-finger nucleic acid-binding protein
MLACPRCAQGLIRYACEDVELVRCWGGHGVWIDNALSQRLASRELPRAVVDEIARLEAHAPPADAPTPGACPECRQPLRSYFVELGQLHVDVCKQHGTWLDTGELARIARGDARKRAPLPAGSAAPRRVMTEQESCENTRRLESLVSSPAEGTYAKGLRVLPGAILTSLANGVQDAATDDSDDYAGYGDHGEFGPGDDLLTRVCGVISFLVGHDDD